jgi:secondary thiamine-phosphate synthase enzyme
VAKRKQLEISTGAQQRFIDISEQVRKVVQESGIEEGVCYVFCPHTTAGLTLNENWDNDVQHDMGLGLDAISPQRSAYRHGEGNSPAHIKSSLIGASEVLFVEQGDLVLGTWQGLYLAEFDGPRRRKVFVKVVAD